jgi:hypothetical protein
MGRPMLFSIASNTLSTVLAEPVPSRFRCLRSPRQKDRQMFHSPRLYHNANPNPIRIPSLEDHAVFVKD